MCCNDVMSSNGHDAWLADVAAIELIKYRYLRALDTKHWDDFADTLTEDVVGDYGSSMGEEAPLHQPRRPRRVHALVARHRT